MLTIYILGELTKQTVDLFMVKSDLKLKTKHLVAENLHFRNTLPALGIHDTLNGLAGKKYDEMPAAKTQKRFLSHWKCGNSQKNSPVS